MDSILQIIMILCCTTEVSGILKCYTCNKLQRICKENTTLAASDGQHVTDCKGTCFIRKIVYNAKLSFFRRGCDDNYQIEITSTLNTDKTRGFLCHCKTDFCNINLRVCESPLPDESTASMVSMSLTYNLCIVLNAIFTLLIFV